jgi:hypothetical protein
MTNEQETGYERGWRRRRSRDALGTVVWALIFIWAGLVMLADTLGMLSRMQVRVSDMPGPWRQLGLDAWPLIFLGAGVLIGVEIVLRLIVPAFRRPVAGSVLIAVLFIGLGLGSLTNWILIWPVLLIALGVAMLVDGFLRSR